MKKRPKYRSETGSLREILSLLREELQELGFNDVVLEIVPIRVDRKVTMNVYDFDDRIVISLKPVRVVDNTTPVVEGSSTKICQIHNPILYELEFTIYDSQSQG